jgi:hypothetical protein
MRKILCCVLILSICLCSCQHWRENFPDIKADFSKFDGSKDVALAVTNDAIYFSDYEIDLNELIKDDDSQRCWVRATVLGNDKIYLLVNKKTNGQWSFSICRCDLSGDNLEMIYEQKKLDRSITLVGISEKLIYIQYKSQKITFVDCFNYYTEEYLSLGSGKNVHIDDYYEYTPSPYSVERSEKQFVISDNTSEIAVIDESFLKNTVYYDLIEKYEFLPFQYSLAYNKITLVYRAKPALSPTAHYPMLVFEYDVTSNELIYLAVFNPYDCEGMKVLYNIKTILQD